jgi:hypothetical protein
MESKFNYSHTKVKVVFYNLIAAIYAYYLFFYFAVNLVSADNVLNMIFEILICLASIANLVIIMWRNVHHCKLTKTPINGFWTFMLIINSFTTLCFLFLTISVLTFTTDLFAIIAVSCNSIISLGVLVLTMVILIKIAKNNNILDDIMKTELKV